MALTIIRSLKSAGKSFNKYIAGSSEALIRSRACNGSCISFVSEKPWKDDQVIKGCFSPYFFLAIELIVT